MKRFIWKLKAALWIYWLTGFVWSLRASWGYAEAIVSAEDTYFPDYTAHEAVLEDMSYWGE